MSAMKETESQTRPLRIRSDISADREHHGQGEVSISHLFPQEASHTKRARFVEAEAKQAQKHDNQQDDVSREADENVEIDNVRVGQRTSNPRSRFIADLGMDEFRRSTTFQAGHSPAQLLVPWHA
jgi:hypothetical protein